MHSLYFAPYTQHTCCDVQNGSCHFVDCCGSSWSPFDWCCSYCTHHLLMASVAGQVSQTQSVFALFPPAGACRHMQQPIYWPAPLPSNPSTYQKAFDSIKLKSSQGGHPKDNLDDIFGKGESIKMVAMHASVGGQAQKLGVKIRCGFHACKCRAGRFFYLPPHCRVG